MVEVIKQIQTKISATIDGIAGDKTIAKCKEYQKANGLTSQLVQQGKLRYTYRISSKGNAVHIDIN